MVLFPLLSVNSMTSSVSSCTNIERKVGISVKQDGKKTIHKSKDSINNEDAAIVCKGGYSAVSRYHLLSYYGAY